MKPIKVKSLNSNYTDSEIENKMVRSFLSFERAIEFSLAFQGHKEMPIGYNIDEDGITLIWE